MILKEGAMSGEIDSNSRISLENKKTRKALPKGRVSNKRRVVNKNKLVMVEQLELPVKPEKDIPIPYNVTLPIYDFDTTNESFLLVHEQLKMLGIKNNAFHLTLLNPLLKGVDPYDENLTNEQVCMIIQECKLNMFYYLREVVRIEEQGGGLVKFRMDRATLAACFCFYNNINFYLMKPRQTGKTVGIVAMLSWAMKFSGPNGEAFSAYLCVISNDCVSMGLIAGNGLRAFHQNGTGNGIRQWYESRKNGRMDYAEIKANIYFITAHIGKC